MTNDSPPSPPDVSAPHGIGRLISGVCIGAGWVLLHVAAYYLIFVSGFLIEMLLGFLKTILFPGKGNAFDFHEGGTWARLLTAGLTLAGAAGVPLGLRVFWKHRARPLMRAFWLLLLAGIVLEAAAFVSLVKSGIG